MEIGQELLFDYADKQSAAPFLRSCPVCSPAAETMDNGPASTSNKRPMEQDGDHAPAAKKPAREQQPSTSSSSTSYRALRKFPQPRSDDDGDDETEQQQQPPACATSATKQSSCQVSERELPAQKSKLSVLAASADLNKKQRNTLYAAARKQFPGAPSRSMLVSWMPTITAENASAILLRSKTEAANKMLQAMQEKSKERQEKISKSFRADQDDDDE